MTRLQHMLLVLGTGQLHFRENELDPDQSLLWIKLFRIREYYTIALLPLRRILMLVQDVAEEV